MWRLPVSTIIAAVLLLGAASSQQKDDKKDDKPPAKLKGQLPAHYKKLGLRDDQIQKIYKIRSDYKAKRDDLQRRLDQLKNEERQLTEKVLTAEQLKRLRELRSGEKSDK